MYATLVHPVVENCLEVNAVSVQCWYVLASKEVDPVRIPLGLFCVSMTYLCMQFG